MWEAETGACVRTFTGHTDEVPAHGSGMGEAGEGMWRRRGSVKAVVVTGDGCGGVGWGPVAVHGLPGWPCTALGCEPRRDSMRPSCALLMQPPHAPPDVPPHVPLSCTRRAPFMPPLMPA